MANEPRRPKRHHYVPQFLLRNFVDERGALCYAHRAFPKGEVITGGPPAFFAEKDLYTRDLTNEPDIELENFYRELEGRVAPILKTLIANAQSKTLPLLEHSQLGTLVEFLFHQIRRVPALHVQVRPPNETQDEKINHIVRVTGDSLPEDVRDQLIDPDIVDGILNNALIDALHTENPEILSALMKMTVSAIVVEKPNKAFIVGSVPVVLRSPRAGGTLYDPGAHLFLPVSSKVMAVLSRRSQIIASANDERVRALNLMVAAQSDAIAGPSRELVRSLRWPR